MKVPRHIVVGLALFFVMCTATIFFAHGMVNSPDEAANKIFIETWCTHTTLHISLAEQFLTSYPLFPRSTVPQNNILTPSGFVGIIILFGTIAKIFGMWIVPFLTLIFTLCGAFAWWYLMRKIFDEKIAACAFWFFLFHPAIIYYTVRGLFPNVVLMDMLIVAIACAWFVYEKIHIASRCTLFFVGILGIFCALCAIMVRPPEALVMFGVTLVVAMVFGSRALRRASAVACAVFLYLGAMLWVMRSVGLLPGGYSFLQTHSLFDLFFPFGIHLKLIWHNAIYFIVKLFSPWVVVSTAGALWWLWRAYKERTYNRRIAAYLSIIFPVSLWLFAVYGSWQFSDNPADPNAVTLGASYVRYWLPHLVFRMPFAAYLFYEIARVYPQFRPWVFKICVCVGFAIVLGLQRAFFGTDGLIEVNQQLSRARMEVREVRALMPTHAVLAVRAWDKYFFPDVHVLQPFPSEFKTYSAARELLIAHIPVWAFIETLQMSDILWLTRNGIALHAVKNFGPHTLYELQLWQK